jgi:hypothetical protein
MTQVVKRRDTKGPNRYSEFAAYGGSDAGVYVFDFLRNIDGNAGGDSVLDGDALAGATTVAVDSADYVDTAPGTEIWIWDVVTYEYEMLHLASAVDDGATQTVTFQEPLSRNYSNASILCVTPPLDDLLTLEIGGKFLGGDGKIAKLLFTNINPAADLGDIKTYADMATWLSLEWVLSVLADDIAAQGGGIIFPIGTVPAPQKMNPTRFMVLINLTAQFIVDTNNAGSSIGIRLGRARGNACDWHEMTGAIAAP